MKVDHAMHGNKAPGYKSGPAGQKVEPKPTGINPGWVAQFGANIGTHTMEGKEVKGGFEKMHRDRGYKAPKAGSDTHRGGSQGRYK